MDFGLLLCVGFSPARTAWLLFTRMSQAPADLASFRVWSLLSAGKSIVVSSMPIKTLISASAGLSSHRAGGHLSLLLCALGQCSGDDVALTSGWRGHSRLDRGSP